MSDHGSAERRFDRVREAFDENVKCHHDNGAAFCLYVDGARVVDIWDGAKDDAGAKWESDTTALVFSVTKGAAAICALMLIERKLLNQRDLVAGLWEPSTTVEMVLSHRAGLPVIEPSLTLNEAIDGQTVVNALTQQRPQWQPDSAHGYHALTYGWLLGRIVAESAQSKSLRTFFRHNVADPLGLDFRIGLPANEQSRVATLGWQPQRAIDEKSIDYRAVTLNGAFKDWATYNTPEVHATELPAANGITSARSLAKLYAACVGDVDGAKGSRLLKTRTLLDALKVRSDGVDAVLPGTRTTFGLGFMRPSKKKPRDGIQLLGPTSFGHPGASGSLGFGDRDAKVGFGYVTRQIRTKPGVLIDYRARRLIEAVKRCLS